MTDSKSATTPEKVVVVGSGFGGAVVACRLSQERSEENSSKYSVTILEMGDEFPDGRGNCEVEYEMPGVVKSFGHYQIDYGTGMHVVRGTGVGGGSLHYYGVRLRIPPKFFDQDKPWYSRWPQEITHDVLTPYYNLAGDMLQATPLEYETEQEGITTPPPHEAKLSLTLPMIVDFYRWKLIMCQSRSIPHLNPL